MNKDLAQCLIISLIAIKRLKKCLRRKIFFRVIFKKVTTNRICFSILLCILHKKGSCELLDNLIDENELKEMLKKKNIFFGNFKTFRANRIYFKFLIIFCMKKDLIQCFAISLMTIKS